MKFDELESEAVGLDRGTVAAVFEPFVARHVTANDPQWRKELFVRRIKIARKFLKRMLLGWLPRYQRDVEFIQEEYDDVWSGTDYDNYSLEKKPTKYSPWEWGSDLMLASTFGGTRFRQLLLIKTIERVRPRSVLEVGCGNGINLLLLAGRFPDVEFAGIDLTREGHEAALRFQQHETFPAHMKSFAPMPLLDDKAFRRVRFYRGTAEKLPFNDGEFDLVYTVLALEQMERIRRTALAEIARVARRNTLMIEPFRDVNTGFWRWLNVVRRNYFRGGVDELSGYGLTPLFAARDFPQETFLKACAVLSAKS